MLTFEVVQGSALDETITILNRVDLPITTYLGAETLAVRLSRGDDQAAILLPDLAATWVDAELGKIRIADSGTDTATLEEGDYEGFLSITSGGVRRERPIFTLKVIAQPGTATAPRSYIGMSDLTKLASYLDDLLSSSDQTNFAEQRAEASRWVDDILLARRERDLMEQRALHGAIVEVNPIVLTAGVDLGPGWGRSSLPDTTIDADMVVFQDALDADGLILDRDAKAITARYALYLILTPQIADTAKDGTPYQALARRFHAEAQTMLAGWVARVVVGGITYRLAA